MEIETQAMRQLEIVETTDSVQMVEGQKESFGS